MREKLELSKNNLFCFKKKMKMFLINESTELEEMKEKAYEVIVASAIMVSCISLLTVGLTFPLAQRHLVKVQDLLSNDLQECGVSIFMHIVQHPFSHNSIF